MVKTFTITLLDNLEKVLTAQAERLNQAPEEVMLQVLTRQLMTLLQNGSESDPLLRLIGSITVDVPDLVENHDRYIGQELYQELRVDG